MEDIVDLMEILVKYDELEELKNLERARAKSIRAEKRERRTRQEKIQKEFLIKKVLPAIVVGALLVGGGTLTFKTVQGQIDNPLSMANLSGQIGAIVNSNPDPLYGKMSILSQNTERISNGFFYKHDEIAKDLLKLDEPLFDYAFCTVCNDMGVNINNEVAAGGRSNINAVIYYLKTFAGNKNSSLFSEYVQGEFNEIETIDDYLIKHGYVDKEGKPSIPAFKEACEKNAQVIADILESRNVEKGTHI